MNMGHYLWGVQRVNRFVNVHLHCIVSDLKKVSKMSMLHPLEKFLRTRDDNLLFYSTKNWQTCATARKKP